VHARRVDSLALYEPVAFRMLAGDDEALHEVLRIAERVGSLAGAGRNHDAARVFVDFWSGAGYFDALPMPARSAIARRVVKVPLDFAAAMRWRPRAAELRSIAAPVLLLAGRDSPPVTRRISAALALELGCQVQECGAGHMGPLTEPECVNPRLEAFVAHAAKHSKQDSAACEIGLLQAAPTVRGTTTHEGVVPCTKDLLHAAPAQPCSAP